MTMQFANLKAQYAALKPDIDARIQRVLDHGQYIMGPEVAELEAALAQRCGARHCITVASGTEALLIALMALDIVPGDEVITVPFTFAASAEAIVLAGGVPVFVDVEADTALLDVRQLERAITARTRAIMPVSLYGQCADMHAINAIASRHGLAVIEDAAQSFGARYGGLRGPGHSGALSTWGAISFFPSKPLGCYGDGGGLFTSDDALAQAAREIRVHGQQARYQHSRIGVGGRMDTLQCAIVLAKLPRFDWELDRRRALAARYDAALTSVPGVMPIVVRGDRDSVYAQYTVIAEHRDAVASALKARGIPTAVHYPQPLHHQLPYRRYAQAQDFPVATHLAAHVLSLPMSADLQEVEQDHVIEALTHAAVASAAAGKRGSHSTN